MKTEVPTFHIIPETYFGEDMQRLFALNLLDTIAARVTKQNPNALLVTTWGPYLEEKNAIIERLQNGNHYFSESIGGSVFTNFKHYFEQHIPHTDDLMAWQRRRNITGSTHCDDAFRNCLESVKKWWK